MGCRASSQRQRTEERSRRRLSINFGGINGSKGGNVKVAQVEASEWESVATVLNNAAVALALGPMAASACSVPDTGAKSSAIKAMTRIGSPQTVRRDVGYTCRKGLEPDSFNQDAWAVLEVVKNFSIYAIFDGHGLHGHFVSNFVKDELLKVIVQDDRFKTWMRATAGTPERDLELLRGMATEAFAKVQDMIREGSAAGKFDASHAGTTATFCIHDLPGRKYMLAHVADSTCVLGKSDLGVASCNSDLGVASSNSRTSNLGVASSNSRTSNLGVASSNSWTSKSSRTSKLHFQAEVLTRDHKPDVEDEKERIEQAGGRVEFDGYQSYRVFDKGGQIPGISMSRCLGDLYAHDSCGVTCVPETNVFDVPSDDGVLLLCSDGVWEFVSPIAAVTIVMKYHKKGQATKAADKLAKHAWQWWIKDTEGQIVDDITVLCVFLNKI